MIPGVAINLRHLFVKPFDFLPFLAVIVRKQLSRRSRELGITEPIRSLDPPSNDFSDDFGLSGIRSSTVFQKERGISIAAMPMFPLLGFKTHQMGIRR